MARGVAKHYLDNPVFLTCWCGRRFQQKADNQLHCSGYHRNLASSLRKFMPKVPPPSPPQKKKPRTPVLEPKPIPDPTIPPLEFCDSQK
jgi:hypothetical protein